MLIGVDMSTVDTNKRVVLPAELLAGLKLERPAYRGRHWHPDVVHTKEISPETVRAALVRVPGEETVRLIPARRSAGLMAKVRANVGGWFR